MSVSSPGAAALPGDLADVVLPFSVPALDVRGRVVRLGAVVDDIIARHAYPPAVSRCLAEAVALTTLLGTSLKFDGRFLMQAQTDGPVSMLLVDFETPGRLRACARFDKDAVAALPADAAAGEMLGAGALAMTIDQGPDMNRYQGVVGLDGGSLEDAAHQYFRQSEQIPTFLRLTAAQVYAGAGGPRWRAGGLLVQYLPDGGPGRAPDLPPGDAPEDADVASAEDAEADAWREARLLAATVEHHELADPSMSSEELLYRLYHERGVRVFEPTAVEERCRCSRERVHEMLVGFPDDDRAEMVREDGRIEVTCEFCSRAYDFAPDEFGAS